MTVLRSKDRADLVVESIVAKPVEEEIQDHESHHSGLLGRHTRVPSMEALNLIVTTIEAEEEPHGISDYDFMEGGMMMLGEEPSLAAPSIAPLIGTWEKDMAVTIREKMEEKPTNRPFMVGLVGMPGKYYRLFDAWRFDREFLITIHYLCTQVPASRRVSFCWPTNWRNWDFEA